MRNKKGKRLKNTRLEKKSEEFVPKAFQKNKKENFDSDVESKYSSRTNNRKHKYKREKKHKKFKKVIIISILIVVLISGITLGVASHKWKSLAKQMLVNENSIVVDINGAEIARLGCEKKHEKIAFNEIPDNLKNAYVAIEDERFYSHGGVDIKRTGAAIVNYVLHFGSSSYGGSTITQQLVKNLTGDSTDSITRKVKEWWKAWQLESCLSKDEILEAYLNIIYVGPNMYGVQTGAKYYFSKHSQDLTLEECAFLAGINNSPNSYNPFGNTDNTERITKRTKTVLAKMLELGYIKEESYNQAISNVDKGLNFKEGIIERQDAVYSYHTDALIFEVTEDIEEKYNISEDFATNYLNMAGLTIHSNQDSEVQKQTETEFEKSKYKLSSKNGSDSSQAAMVIIDHSTGKVVACTGGLGKKTTARPLNRATQSIRQTGSAIKPIAVLAPALDKKIITAASIYDDTERDFADGYHPTDYSTPLGKITIRRAVESSQNIPFVEIMEELKPSNAIPYLEKMGVTTLTEEDNTLVLSLGGLQKGISPLEMAGAYATIANDGQYIEPTFYSQIDNKSGEVIIKPTQEKRKVFSKEVAYVLKEILTQPVVGSNGTATYCKISGVDVAAKTGTTDENYDRWLCGFTPYYTAVTWYGFDQNESIYFNKRNPAGLLWANVMSRIHSGLETATFEKPSSVKAVTICSKTGERAKTNCPNKYVEYFLDNTVPGLCSEHTGSEYKENDNSTNVKNDKNKGVVQNITTDIDAEEPQRITPQVTEQKDDLTSEEIKNDIDSNDESKEADSENRVNNTNNVTGNTTTNNKNNNLNNSTVNNVTNSNKNTITNSTNSTNSTNTNSTNGLNSNSSSNSNTHQSNSSNSNKVNSGSSGNQTRGDMSSSSANNLDE